MVRHLRTAVLNCVRLYVSLSAQIVLLNLYIRCSQEATKIASFWVSYWDKHFGSILISRMISIVKSAKFAKALYFCYSKNKIDYLKYRGQVVQW